MPLSKHAGSMTPLAHTWPSSQFFRFGRVVRLQASAQEASSLERSIKIVGCGSCGVDYLASVAAFPHPDQKLRTDALEVQGGGNCANALTAAARLGLKPQIVTKIGGDGLGDGIITELQADDINTELILREPGHPSPFTYIIVDRAGGTRTCIHTPGAAFAPDEMTSDLISRALKDAALVYFDGRLTEAAILLARAARASGIPVLVEGERLRPGLQDLLAEADYVVTSAHFPQEWTGEATVGDALEELCHRLPRAQMIFTTQGSKGSVCLVKTPVQGDSCSESSLQTLLEDMFSTVSEKQLQNDVSNGTTDTAEPVCVSNAGISISPARLAETAAPVQLSRYSDSSRTAAAAQAAQAAAQRAAALNADAGNSMGYVMAQASADSDSAVAVHVLVASAAGIPPEAVADTTGAGDAFIGSVLYGIATGMSPQQMLRLGAAVAACKCTALGARPGLPRREQLASHML